MGEQESVTIERARSVQDFEATRSLFAAYAKAMGLDLAFQEFDTELGSLPGKYAPPTGEILLACDSAGIVLGCVAVRPLTPDCCEMKRLYILPGGRGMGLGKKLVNAIMDVAGCLGYKEIKLDTLPSMVQALSLYRGLGFVATAPYYITPLTGTIFLVRSLSSVPTDS